jgi:hypothetical protein
MFKLSIMFDPTRHEGTIIKERPDEFKLPPYGNSTVEDWTGPLPKPPVDPNEVRTERNKLLSESDWTQLSDAPVDKAAWATYRQALRDVPNQTGFPSEITWPDAP